MYALYFKVELIYIALSGSHGLNAYIGVLPDVLKYRCRTGEDWQDLGL